MALSSKAVSLMSLGRNKNRDSLSQCVFDCGQVTKK